MTERSDPFRPAARLPLPLRTALATGCWVCRPEDGQALLADQSPPLPPPVPIGPPIAPPAPPDPPAPMMIRSARLSPPRRTSVAPPPPELAFPRPSTDSAAGAAPVPAAGSRSRVQQLRRPSRPCIRRISPGVTLKAAKSPVRRHRVNRKSHSDRRPLRRPRSESGKRRQARRSPEPTRCNRTHSYCASSPSRTPARSARIRRSTRSQDKWSG